MTELRPELHVLRPEAVAGALNQVGQGREQSLRGENEQEWHKHAACYCALGMTAVQVAERCGVHPNTVYALQRTTMFQERVTRIMAEQDRDIMDAFKAASMGAVMKLVQLSQTAESESVQLGATKEILDRHLGKALQRVEAETTVRSGDPVREAEQLRAQIASLIPASEAAGSTAHPTLPSGSGSN